MLAAIFGLCDKSLINTHRKRETHGTQAPQSAGARQTARLQSWGKAIGAAYRKHIDRHFPAMTLAGVSGLFDERAKVEIEAVAMLS